MWRQTLAGLVLLVAVSLGGASASAAPVVQLTVKGDPGEFILDGKEMTLSSDQVLFEAALLDITFDGLPDGIQFATRQEVGPNSVQDYDWRLEFYTDGLNRNLAVGTYPNALGYEHNRSGFPGIHVTGRGRYQARPVGSFTIAALEFDDTGYSPRLKRCVVHFEQRREGAKPALRGTLTYTEDFPKPPPSPDLTGAWGAVRVQAGRWSGRPYTAVQGVLVVRNVGPRPSPRCAASIVLSEVPWASYSGVPVRLLTVPSLRPGQTVRLYFTTPALWGFVPRGWYLHAVIDQELSVPEMREANNFFATGPLLQK